MEPLALVIIIAVIFLLLRAPTFESTFLVILGAPLVAFLLAKVNDPLADSISQAQYLLSLTILTLFAILVVWLFRKEEPLNRLREGEPIIIFAAAYVIFYQLTQLWPDFVSIGERLRDYAILSSTNKNPIRVEEPWFAGAEINYYLYWYRFATMLSEIYSLRVWQSYHAVQAFTFSLYFTTIYLFLRRLVPLSVAWSLFSAIVVTLGSNAAGVRDFLFGEKHWWGPSRVVTGAINEFPAWSFILGDVHPHFLNLPLLSFLLLALWRINCALKSSTEVVTVWICGFLLAFGFTYNANAWENPAVLALFFSVLVLALIRSKKRSPACEPEPDASGGIVRSAEFCEPTSNSAVTDSPTRASLIFIAGILTVISLTAFYLYSRNISAGELPISIVKAPITRTPTFEFFLHWGIPFSLLAICATLLQRSAVATLLVAIGLIVTLTLPSAIWFLGLLTFALAIIAIRKARECETFELPIFALGAAGLVLIIFPEFLFFDDSYGGDIERMNTIFKFYSFAWLPIHLLAITLTVITLRSSNFPKPPTLVLAITSLSGLVLLLGFFLQTVQLRKSPPCKVEPCNRGLTSLENEFPGSALLIKTLSEIRPGIVLEAQGPAYSYTSHVATLSGQTSYLGWANHVNLLLKAYGEVARREQVTSSVYSTLADCESIKQTLIQEKIAYLVLGPLEQRAFPQINAERFSCLQPLLSSGQYKLFTPLH